MLNPQQFSVSEVMQWRSSDVVHTDAEGRRSNGLVAEAMEQKRNREHYQSLKDDIARNGLQEPLRKSPRGVLYEGHTRLAALEELGHRSVPVVIAEH